MCYATAALNAPSQSGDPALQIPESEVKEMCICQAHAQADALRDTPATTAAAGNERPAERLDCRLWKMKSLVRNTRG